MSDIPKTLHYCWFGGAPLPESARVSLETWHELMPDHEIVRWDESSFDVRQCPFASEAYDAVRWAFVSDYARFKVIYEHGGTYMDVGSRLLRSAAPLERGEGFTAASLVRPSRATSDSTSRTRWKPLGTHTVNTEQATRTIDCARFPIDEPRTKGHAFSGVRE